MTAGEASATPGPILLHGGTIVDPERGTVRGDVLIRDGSIAAVGHIADVDARDAARVDAAGLHIAPGFIDIHTHVFSRPELESSRLPADRVGIRQGVTCVVDAGSSGARTIDGFPEVRESQITPLFALINIGSPGVPGTGGGAGGHSSRPELVSLEATVKAVERHHAWIRGIKVQASHSHVGTYGMTAVALARKAADLTGLPLMMHIGNAPPVLDEVLPYLTAGDIVTHTFHGKVGGALTFGDAPLPALLEAVKRGVVIDVGHGRSSFAFATAERALEAGLRVHTISTDIHRGNVDRYVVSLARTMSKLLLLGLTLDDVVRAVTAVPARALRLEADGFGSIARGRPANLTVFRLSDESIDLEDAEGEVRRSSQWIEPLKTYVRGVPHNVDAPI